MSGWWNMKLRRDQSSRVMVKLGSSPLWIRRSMAGHDSYKVDTEVRFLPDPHFLVKRLGKFFCNVELIETMGLWHHSEDRDLPATP